MVKAEEGKNGDSKEGEDPPEKQPKTNPKGQVAINSKTLLISELRISGLLSNIRSDREYENHKQESEYVARCRVVGNMLRNKVQGRITRNVSKTQDQRKGKQGCSEAVCYVLGTGSYTGRMISTDLGSSPQDIDKFSSYRAARCSQNWATCEGDTVSIRHGPFSKTDLKRERQ